MNILAFVTLLLVVLAYNTTGISQKLDVLTKTTDFDIEIIKTKNKVTFTNNTLEHRILINYLALNEIANSFPLGVGIGDYQDVLNKNYQKIRFKSAMKQGYNNHNQYVSEFLKTGLLGGCIFLILLFYLFKSSNINNEYYLILLLLFSVGCFFESYLDRQHGVFIFSFFIPLFYKYDEFESN